MQIEQTKKEELKCEFTVKLTAEEIDEKVAERLKEIGQTVKLPGFRPGKIPMNILKAKYGDAVMGEVLEKAVNDSSLKAINENDLRPAMQPKIEVTSFEKGKGLEYTMAVEILPEIKLADLKKIKLERLTSEPEKKTVDEALDRIADSQKASEPVKEKRAAKNGDIVVINFDGTVDGKAFPGMKGEGHELELGSQSFVDTFEEQLVGAKAGDHRSVTVTFPDPYASAELAGKEAVFEVDVTEIRKPVKPKIDEEFATKIGFDDLKSLREAIEKQIQGEYDRLSYMNVKRQLLDSLDGAHKFDAPEGMIDAEFEGIWAQVQQHAHEGHDHAPGEACDHDHDDLDKDEYREIAERRVRLGLVLAEVGRENNIEVSQTELQQAVITEAQRYPGQEREIFEYYQKTPQALENLRAPLYENKVVDFILEMVHIDDRKVSVDELTKAVEEEETPKAGKSDKKKAKKSSSKTASKKASDKKPAAKKSAAKADTKKKGASTKKK